MGAIAGCAQSVTVKETTSLQQGISQTGFIDEEKKKKEHIQFVDDNPQIKINGQKGSMEGRILNPNTAA